MTDILVNKAPLPLPRPSGLEMEYPPSTDFKMPLEGPRKLTDAFLEGTRYPPTGEGVKSLYGLLIEFKRHITKTGENMAEILSQLQTGYLDGPVVSNNFTANFIEFVIYSGLAIGSFAIGYLFLTGVGKAINYFRGK